MKQIIFSIATFCLSTSAMSQTTLIPDVNFEQALITLGYDTGIPDGSVITANISNVTYLPVLNHNMY